MEKFVQNEHFLGKYFTPYEAAYVGNSSRKTQSLAGIFCAKEAFLKALGLGIGGGIDLNQIEVNHDSKGKPFIKLTDSAKLIVAASGISEVQISISHTNDISTAICIMK